jgi:3-phytase
MPRTFVALLFFSVGLAACEPPDSPITHRVPDDADRIQTAVDRASDGDTVLLAPGTYRESIDIQETGLVLTSEYARSGRDRDIERTVLDGGGNDYALRIGPEGGEVTITGLTIRNADDGITAERPFTLTHCLVTRTTDGIDYEGGGGLVEQCRFVHNRDDAIDLDQGTAATLRRNVLAYNQDDGIEIRLHPYEGDSLHTHVTENWIVGNGEDGIQVIDYETPSPRSFRVDHNVIAGNAMAGIGVMGDENTTENYEGDAIQERLVIANNTIADNDHGITGGGRVAAVNNILAGHKGVGAKNVMGESSLSHTLFFDNAQDTMNVQADKESLVFADPRWTDHYELADDSPARASGTDSYEWNGENVAAAGSMSNVANVLGAARPSTLRMLTWDRSAVPDTVEITEAFETVPNEPDNVDTPAFWHGPDDTPWLLSTAKEGDVIRAHDATTGDSLRRIGGEGTAPGQMDRPNGVAVVDDLMLVVERNNRRVQVFRLPEAEPLGFIGEDHLRWPYGLTLYTEDDEYVLYVTDMYETPNEEIPPDAELDERVKQYRFLVDGEIVNSEHVRSFGDTSGPGVLRKVESIWVDPSHDRLLIAEELEGESHIKVYTLDGSFTGETIPTEYFPHEAEGITLYECPDGTGYWITTDQDEKENTFHVFDRAALTYEGSFRGTFVSNTDGVIVTSQPVGPFEEGAFYAVHDDRSTVAFDWVKIASLLDLDRNC